MRRAISSHRMCSPQGGIAGQSRFALTYYEKNTAGSCLTEVSLWETGDYEAEVMVLLAGYAAEKRAHADADPRHSGSDTERALECIEWIEQVGSEREWRARADAFVAKEWDGIEALARELLGRETLDSMEAEIVVDIARGSNEVTTEHLVQYRALREKVLEGT